LPAEVLAHGWAALTAPLLLGTGAARRGFGVTSTGDDTKGVGQISGIVATLGSYRLKVGGNVSFGFQIIGGIKAAEELSGHGLADPTLKNTP